VGSRLTIRVPGDYVLARDVCSYGYFLLAPNHWNVDRQSLTRPLELDGGAATAVIGQSGGAGSALGARFDRALSRDEQRTARARITRMLRLDEDEAHVAAFHRVDRRWKRSGRARLFRSPTMFEDVIKTVTSCNVTWPSTVHMNRRLCETINPAFPRPTQLARKRPATLRAQCRVGYRDARLVDLAKLAAAGDLDEAWFADPANDDDTVFKRLRSLPGVGPYAAGNIMQLLGRYSRLPLDTESIRHGKNVLGMKGTDAQLFKKLQRHYEPFGDHRFRSYWFELWDFYESLRGPAWTWEPKTTGTTFTASQLDPGRTRQRSGKSTSRRKRSVSHT